MTAKKRPAPSFRPNLRLSHFIYDGPDARHYQIKGEVARKATGEEDGEGTGLTEVKNTGLPFFRRSQEDM
jgi:hypothetical protein